MEPIDRSEITPEPLYLNRRRFLRAAGATVAGLLLAACAAPRATPTPARPTEAPGPVGGSADELGSPLTSYAKVTGYNNFYEFSYNKTGWQARSTNGFITSPWQVEVAGLVARPRAFSIEELVALGQEERIYRMRCVEAWSMVIPWLGFPLSRLLQLVEPLPAAQYVRFTSVLAPDQLPSQNDPGFPWPYVEGLRLDEAMHDLTILATGVYGKPLPAQEGAPIRLVVPWKYGFKSAKSIVKIELVDRIFETFWMASGGGRYGFWANVYPNGIQAREQRIGEDGLRATLPFNGYADQVEALYAGMDPAQIYH